MYINSNLTPSEIATMYCSELPMVQDWAYIAENLYSSDLSLGDSAAGYPDEDCLQEDIITPLSNLIKNISKAGSVNKKHLLEALRIIEQSAIDTESRLHQSGEYAKGDLNSLSAKIEQLKGD